MENGRKWRKNDEKNIEIQFSKISGFSLYLRLKCFLLLFLFCCDNFFMFFSCLIFMFHCSLILFSACNENWLQVKNRNIVSFCFLFYLNLLSHFVQLKCLSKKMFFLLTFFLFVLINKCRTFRLVLKSFFFILFNLHLFSVNVGFKITHLFCCCCCYHNILLIHLKKKRLYNKYIWFNFDLVYTFCWSSWFVLNWK